MIKLFFHVKSSRSFTKQAFTQSNFEEHRKRNRDETIYRSLCESAGELWVQDSRFLVFWTNTIYWIHTVRAQSTAGGSVVSTLSWQTDRECVILGHRTKRESCSSSCFRFVSQLYCFMSSHIIRLFQNVLHILCPFIQTDILWSVSDSCDVFIFSTFLNFYFCLFLFSLKPYLVRIFQ